MRSPSPPEVFGRTSSFPRTESSTGDLRSLPTASHQCDAWIARRGEDLRASEVLTHGASRGGWGEQLRMDKPRR